MANSNLLVVDIETVPDRAYHEGEAFPKLPFHQVVAIAFVEAGIERDDRGDMYSLREVRSGGEISYTESQLVEGFFQYFERLKPKLVTYNGRSFDIPVLRYRAMAHSINAPWLYQGGTRYSTYLYRYGTDWHCDMIEVLSDFGASKTAKLDEVSRLLGFPGKFGIDGSEVEGLYKAGKVAEIRNYCETDALNTYLIYLRYVQHCGHMTKERYEKAVSQVIRYVDAEGTKRPHLIDFRNEWLGSNSLT